MVLGGEDFLLRQDLDSLPVQGVAEAAEGVELTVGRLPGRQAVQLKGQSLSWDLVIPQPYGIEFWVKPVGWDGSSTESILLADFRTEGGVLSLSKAAETEELVLALDGVSLARYPVYDWKDHPWREGQERSRWHYVQIGVKKGQVELEVDGFRAQSGEKPGKNPGRLRRVTLYGGAGTAYSELRVTKDVPDDADGRRRYRNLYRGGPVLEPVTITIPWVEKPPVLDGDVAEADYEEMATLIGFNRNTGDVAGSFEDSGMRGYMGYDGEALYLALKVPYQDRINATHWNRRDVNMWGEEAWLFFLSPSGDEFSEYWLFAGNPHGDQSDLKGTDASWNANWQWEAAIGDGVWSGEMRIPFAELGMKAPKDSEVWTMNLFNPQRRAAWSPSRALHDVRAFGVLRFDRNAPVIRLGEFRLEEDKVVVPFRITGRGPTRRLILGCEVYGGGDTLPHRFKMWEVEVSNDQTEEIVLDVDFDGLKEGILVVFVREGDTTLFYRSGVFPRVSPPVEKTDVVEAGAAEDKPDYAKQWTAEELGEELLAMPQWAAGRAGRSDKVMSPWTPMQVQDETIACWGREFGYKGTLFPEQVTSQGKELLAGAPYLRLKTNKGIRVLKAGKMEVVSATEREVTVRTQAKVDGLSFEVETVYAFDGLAKVTLLVDNEEKPVPVDSLEWVVPLRGDVVRFYHYFGSHMTVPPGTVSGAVPADGFRLDRFRELIWIGSDRYGFTWMAEGMKGWRLKDENGIQRLEPLKSGDYELVITLANRPTVVDSEWDMVFAFQATPTRPRPQNVHRLNDSRRFQWMWRDWGDGEFYPFNDNPEKARERVAQLREKGREVLANTSLTYFGRFRYYANAFGLVDHPGLAHRELLLWEPWWLQTTRPETRQPILPEVQTAEGDWYGKRGQPRGFINLCPNASFQDYYLWRLEQEVKNTGLSALNLLQPASVRCANPLHGCGYTNYRGEWVPSLPIFAMREMVMRMRQILQDSGHEPYIRWHGDDVILVPVLSFVDVFLGGEGYSHGGNKVLEFYSDSLSSERMRVHHTGLPFGFAYSVMPRFESKYAPTEASVWDITGLFFVHDGNLLSWGTPADGMVSHLVGQRLAFNLDEKEIQYYWDVDGPVQVEGGQVMFVLHHDPESALLILFNPGETVAEAQVRFREDVAIASKVSDGMKDVINGVRFQAEDGLFRVQIKPKGMRVLAIGEAPGGK